MSHRAAGALAAVAALLALGMAYFAQIELGLRPCELCLWERWPYRIVAVLAVLAALLPRRPARLALGLALVALLADVGIAGLHVGVERGWWNSPLPECNGMLVPGAPLPAVPAAPCDRPVFLLPFLPVSMAAMDLLYALAFALALGAYVSRRQRRFK